MYLKTDHLSVSIFLFTLEYLFYNCLMIKWLNAVSGEVYTWGWKECVPSGKVIGDPSPGSNMDKEPMEKQSLTLSEQGNALWFLGQ